MKLNYFCPITFHFSQKHSIDRSSSATSLSFFSSENLISEISIKEYYIQYHAKHWRCLGFVMKIFILVPCNVQMCVFAPLGINEKYAVLMLQTWRSSSLKSSWNVCWIVFQLMWSWSSCWLYGHTIVPAHHFTKFCDCV